MGESGRGGRAHPRPPDKKLKVFFVFWPHLNMEQTGHYDSSGFSAREGSGSPTNVMSWSDSRGDVTGTFCFIQLGADGVCRDPKQTNLRLSNQSNL